MLQEIGTKLGKEALRQARQLGDCVHFARTVAQARAAA